MTDGQESTPAKYAPKSWRDWLIENQWSVLRDVGLISIGLGLLPLLLALAGASIDLSWTGLPLR